jgi:hypothetical protein
VCVWERERLRACVREWDLERESVCVWFVWVRFKRCVCVFMCVCVCICVCVCVSLVKQRDKERENWECDPERERLIKIDRKKRDD